ncbi:DNA methyltransferase [Paenibacillus sp. GYB004]|uniref:DNA methyltransferase n=1 Tax=Paenibacillus sp. GYB004 TaxID=2994393 RepID=UPI002F968A11
MIESESLLTLRTNISEVDWEFASDDTQYLTHNIHRYSGKFIPQIARTAIELLTIPGDTVLDPYMGSGTTLIESTLLSRKSVGVDLNPLAVLISKTKVTPIAEHKLTDLKQHFLVLCESLDLYFNPTLFIPPIPNIEELIVSAKQDHRYNNPWYTKWFQNPVLIQLLVLKREIESLSDQDLIDLATVAFSDILRRSSNAHTGYPNVMYDKNAKERALPAKVFYDSLVDVINKVSTLTQQEFFDAKPVIIHGDARCLPIQDNSIDAVISHPPYIGAIPYAEYGSLSLGWLGHDWKSLDEALTGGKRQSSKVVPRFEEGYYEMLSESFRVLKPGKSIFLMVGNPVVRGEIVKLDEMTEKFAETLGFELIEKATRKGVNRRANKMGDEVLFFFKKPQG